MTTQEKLAKRKLSILELAEYLKNVSQACRISGVSRQHFYDIKKAYDEHGLEGLREKTRRKPCFKNRVAPEIEEARPLNFTKFEQREPSDRKPDKNCQCISIFDSIHSLFSWSQLA